MTRSTVSRANYLPAMIVALMMATHAFAEVTSSGETGFNLRITGEVDASPIEAYEQFVRVNEWWIENHTWYGDADNLSLEPRAGGCFCEISGDNEVLHMLVSYVKPGEEIKMIGGLGPLQMMGLHGGMSWRFEPVDDSEQAANRTRIIQTYNVTGYAPGGLKDLAGIVDAVQTDQLNALVAHINQSQKD